MNYVHRVQRHAAKHTGFGKAEGAAISSIFRRDHALRGTRMLKVKGNHGEKKEKEKEIKFCMVNNYTV